MLETQEYDKLLSWCRSHEKLLSIFDEGCADFYVSHKIWNCEVKAQTYKKLSNKELCLEELKTLVFLTKCLNPDAKSEYYQIGMRNPLFFSSIKDPDIQEEYMTTIYFDKLLSKYDTFFGNDEQYLAFKKDLLS